jgi:hypothetical protein
MITWARLGSFRTIMVYARTWAETAGSYRINRTTFPNAELGVAATVQRLHAAGFTVGMHCLTSLVDKRDPLASPRPDGRLLKDGAATLAAKLSAGALDLVLAGQEGVLPRSTEEPGGTDVQVGDEVIRYRRVEAVPDGRLRLLGCERGANGTRASEHTAGAAVHHLAERHGAYLADLRTSLASEIAERLAGLIERVGFDMIYLDAGEVNNANGPYWYWAGRQQEEILRRVNRPLVVQGSGVTAWTWHRFTRGTCDDGVAVGRDAWLEVHKIGRVLAAYRRNRMPAELGWWRLDDVGIGRPRTTASEAGLLGARSLELDVPFSVETTLAALRTNPESAEILEVLGRAERARLGSGTFTREPVRAQPQQTHRAETAAEPFRMLERGTTDGIEVPVPLASAVTAGQTAARIPLRPGGVDLSRYEGISVAVAVEGNTLPQEPAPVLNFQLQTAGGRYRDYLVDLDFEGERTVVVSEPSADRVIRELPPAPGTYPLKASLQNADLGTTKTLNLRWMRGARTNGVVVRVYEVDAVDTTAGLASAAAGVAR